jgi:hypothetical protein
MANSTNRFSLYRDASGYLNYRVIDANGNVYTVGADVSLWKAGQQHHVAVSWVLNSQTKKDEMHLFIDGVEVPNITKYGSHVSPLLHQKFRTISSEDIIGHTPKSIVGSTDMVTTLNSYFVTSSLNFTNLNINTGDILYIEEPGFNSSGYTITGVNGNTLTLSTVMPLSAVGCNFSVNKTSFLVSTQINLFNNIAISVIHSTITDSDLITVSLSNQVYSSHNFAAAGISIGDIIRVNEVGFKDYYTITAVSGNTLTLSDNMPLTTSGSRFIIYSVSEEELPGQNALFPSYQISRDGNFNNILTIKSNTKANDIILIRTLGLNHGRVRNKYYLWGNSSNILNTRLPSPLLLEDVKIHHTLLDTTIIGPNNSTLVSGEFISQHLVTDQPSVSNNGRTLAVTISGDNINYSSSVSVDIIGTINGTPVSTETLVFTENGTKYTVGKVSATNYAIVTCAPINPTRACCTIKISEKEAITTGENSTIVPVIRYSYQMLVGNTLSGTVGSSILQDNSNKFSKENIGNYLIIYSPPAAAGQYLINSISENLNSITVNANMPATFTGGNYEILNVSQARSGLQNGKFTFEDGYQPGIAYPLAQGLYELDYHTGLSIPITPKKYTGFIGSDVNGEHQAKAIIDDFCIFDTKLSDTRIGETLASGANGITRHYNSLKAIKPNSNTLMLLDFDTKNFVNNTNVYLTSTKGFIQSASCVNSNFNKSIAFTGRPLLVDNKGILNTKNEGTIEFWVNPLNDAGNDPNYRFYFDATGAVTEEIVSNNNATVTIAGRASKILSVKLKNGLQGVDYFAGGTIDNDLQTLLLNQKLPNQKTIVVVTYIPTGLSGDRISIYKDPFGYINFTIDGSGVSTQVRAPIFWTKNTWHKLKAQYTINQGLGIDELRFFIDGYEQGNVLFGEGLLFGENMVFGSSFIGHNSIKSAISFTDTINEFTVGSDYTHSYGAMALIDNLRISNVSRPIFAPFGEPIDPGFSTNLDVVFPATQDLYTTLLLDFNKLTNITTDFAVIKNKKTGLFDITINVFDSFGILRENDKAKTVMETLIYALKPANSRVFINYR